MILEGPLLLLVQALGVWVLLPLLLAGLAGTEWGARRGPWGLAALFGLTAMASTWLAAGLTGPIGPARLFELLEMARRAPPEVLRHELPPRLIGLVAGLSAAKGRPLDPPRVEAEAHRIMGLLLEARMVPEPELPHRFPDLLARLLTQGREPGLLLSLADSPQPDPSLGILLAAGLHGGPVAGALAALATAWSRAVSWAPPNPLLLVTLLAGPLGALVGRWRPTLGPSGAWILGASVGVIQAAAGIALSPSGVVEPRMMAGALVLALGHGTSLGLFLLALRAHQFERRDLVARESEARTRLALLAARVRPHFLFNALNTLSAECGSEPDRLRHLIGCLARFLRRTVESGDTEIPLSRELEDLEAYLELVRARFPDRLEVRVRTDPGVGVVPVPALCLQPLVENALEHGFRPEGGILRIEIGCARHTDRLVLSVADDGTGIPPPRLLALGRGEGLGVGLASVRERLAARRPPGALLLEARPGGGVLARVEVPL